MEDIQNGELKSGSLQVLSESLERIHKAREVRFCRKKLRAGYNYAQIVFKTGRNGLNMAYWNISNKCLVLN